MSWQTIIKEKGLDISVINFTELAGRIDAEYYKPAFLLSNKLVENKKSTKLGNLADVKGGKRLPKDESFSEEGIPYIRAEDVKNNFVSYESSPKISQELHQKLKSYQTKFDDVLITIVGNSIGDIGIVKFKLSKCNLTENSAKIVNLKQINADYLFSFLLSKYGQNQIAREKVGTSQPKLALVRIRDFNIPLSEQVLQDKLSEVMSSSQKIKEKSEQVYKKAEQLLLAEINLADYKPSEKNISVRSLSKSLTDNRFDAEYWQPKYEEVFARMRKVTTLAQIAKIKRGSLVSPDYYSEEGTPYVRGADFSINEIDDNGMAYISSNFKRNREVLVNENDIVFASIGSVGKTALVTKKYDKSYISNNIGKINITNKEYLPQYVQICLQSLVGQLQLERLKTQTAQPKISDTDIARIKIPSIPKDKQEQISKRAEQSRELKQEAKDLLEKAKRAVEIFIEQDEKQALAYLNK